MSHDKRVWGSAPTPGECGTEAGCHRSGCLPSARQSGLCCRARVMTGTRTAREQGSSWPSFSRIHNSLGRLGRIAFIYTLQFTRSGSRFKTITKRQERETDRQRSYNAQLDRTGLPPAGYETALRTVFAIALNTKACPTGARYGLRWGARHLSSNGRAVSPLQVH
jgi:hypothetical protein